MNSCRKDSFLRDGKPHDVPARFQIWVRRDTRREPLKERTEHPDLIWVPRSRSNEATIWVCRRGPNIGDIIEAIGTTTPPEDYYGIRCSADAVLILRSIRWRDVLAPLPINHAPNMSQADIVRAYAEAAETAEPHDVEDDHRGIGIPDNGDAKPDAGILSDDCCSWWAQRLDQYKRDLSPDGPLIAHLKEEVVDD